MKKILKILKATIIGLIWTILFGYIANSLMVLFWNFDLFNINHWKVINTFWESGGKIKTGKDYVFVLMLLSIVPLWFLGWRFFYRFKFINLLLFPIVCYNNHMIKKSSQAMPRIVLKNLGSSKHKPNMEEMIERRLKDSNKGAEKEASRIRQNINDKINSANK